MGCLSSVKIWEQAQVARSQKCISKTHHNSVFTLRFLRIFAKETWDTEETTRTYVQITQQSDNFAENQFVSWLFWFKDYLTYYSIHSVVWMTFCLLFGLNIDLSEIKQAKPLSIEMRWINIFYSLIPTIEVYSTLWWYELAFYWSICFQWEFQYLCDISISDTDKK